MAEPAPATHQRSEALAYARRMRRKYVRIRRIQSTEPIEPSPPSGASMHEVRDRVLKALAHHMVDVTDGAVIRSRKFGRELLAATVELIFRTAIKEGSFRLPDGWGVLSIRQLYPSQRRIPTGEIVKLPPLRYRLRYEEGSAVRALLGRPQKTKYARQFVRRTKLTKKAMATAKLTRE